MHRWFRWRPTATLVRHESRLWLVTVAFFVAGDLLTTGVGLEVAGVAEQSPLLRQFAPPDIYVVMVVLKSAMAASCYLVWRTLPEPYCAGIPLGLATVGVGATVWNLLVIATALAG